MSIGKGTIRSLATVSALALSGCAIYANELDTESAQVPPEIPELAPIPDLPPQGFDQSVEAAIEDSLPRVSYSPKSPDYLGPLVHTTPAERRALDRELIEGWIRELDALEGEDAVVCHSTPDSVFGHCSFPAPVAGASEDDTAN